MLIDAKLLPLADKAEKGDAEAQRLLAVAYMTGKGVPKDDNMVQYYSLKMAEQNPRDMPQVAYGSLLCHIGNHFFDVQNYQEAAFWYKRSIQYIRDTYVEDFVVKLIAHLKVEKNLKDAVVQNFLSARKSS